jgi:hypothetical protein
MRSRERPEPMTRAPSRSTGAPRPRSERRRVARAAAVAVLAVVALLGLWAPAALVAAQTTAPRQVGAPAGERLPEPEPSTSASNSEADSVLSGVEYQEPPKSFWETVGEWFQEQLGKVFNSTGSFWSGFAYIILAVLVGAVAFLLVRLRGTARFRGNDAGFEFDLEDRRPPQAWLKDAERFEARGEWKQALRCRFRALVGELIELGALRDLPGRTTGEYRVEMRAFAPAASDAFVGATDLFERAWYGDEATGPEQNARFRDLADRSVTGARAARRASDDTAGVPA